MASAKIVTLAIRTLAKPIATQLKQTAVEHPTFRSVCVGLAQVMHRIEMRMRSNLLGASTEHQKIRPLSENKAIANGANAISEGFLFAVAAALIIGESYRSSRSSAKQRNRTEDAVEEVRENLQELTRALGWSVEELAERRRVRQEAAEAAGQKTDEEAQADAEEPASPFRAGLSSPVAAATAEAEAERERLQRAVQVLLQLALRQGWIQGEDALNLDAIVTGREEEAARQRRQQQAAAATGSLTAAGTTANASDGSIQDRIAALGRPTIVVAQPSSATDGPRPSAT